MYVEKEIHFKKYILKKTYKEKQVESNNPR